MPKYNLTLRRPCRHAWRKGLFYGAPRSHLQVISKRRKMTPLEIQFSFFQKQVLLSKFNGFDTIILQKNFGLSIHFMVFTRFLNVLIKLWSASQNLFSNVSLSFLNKFNNDLISFLSI